MDLESLYLYILAQQTKSVEELKMLRKQAGSFKNACQNSQDRVAAHELAARLEQTKINTLSYFSEEYPKLLKEIFDPPPVLFYKGTLISSDEACVAVVGTRMISAYGQAILPRITSPLIQSGSTIVSGLAYGIDAAAHREALQLKARTIAVLGSGLDEASFYPKQHLRLAQEILDNNGLLLSEQPPGEPAFKQHFVARNRIIAGISLGTVVIECKTKSGALITADFAMDFNRPVYAVPGPIYSANSEGPHRLIKQGATLITNGEDILEDLKLTIISTPKLVPNNTPQEQAVLECIQSSPKSLEEILLETQMIPEELLATLSSLELKHLAKNLGVEGYIKS